MVKGTTSMGGFTRKKVHIRCRRCGKNAYNARHKDVRAVVFPTQKFENILGSNGMHKCKKLQF